MGMTNMLIGPVKTDYKSLIRSKMFVPRKFTSILIDRISIFSIPFTKLEQHSICQSRP